MAKIKCNFKRIRITEFAMTQYEFAEYLGIGKILCNQYELGKTLPNLKKAFEISQKLKRPVEKIWSLTDD